MKKLILIIITCLIFTSNVYAEDSESTNQIKLLNCESTDSITLEVDNKVTHIKLLAYDKSDGELNKTIDEYVCKRISEATNIEIEVDPYSQEHDKYNKKLVWLKLDGVILQEELISMGYGQVNFVSGTYNHLDELCNKQADAIKKTSGIWSYPNIKEEYCNSGINLSNVQNEETKEKEVNKSETFKNLKYVIFLNSGILLLLVILRSKYGKR